MDERYRGFGQPPSIAGSAGAAPATLGRHGVATVFGMLGFSFLFSVLGGVVGLYLLTTGVFGTGFFIVLFIAQLALLFTLRPVAARSAPLGLVMLYGFTFLSGLTLGPIIASYVALGMASIVAEALLLTAMLTFGLTVFGLTTDISLAKFSTWLFIGLLGLIGASVLSFFFQSTLLNIVIGAGGAVLFSVYLIYDVQRIRRQPGDFANAVVLTASVYLDIVNLFLSLLRLLGALQGSNRD